MSEEQKITSKECFGIVPEAVVGVYILNKNGKFLMAHSPKWKTLSLPGGHIEFGETSEQAVIREAKEETGLDVFDPTFLRIVEVVKSEEFGVNRHLVGLQYFVTTDAEENEVKVDGKEITDYVWLTPEECLVSNDIEEREKETIRVYLEKYSKNKKQNLFSKKCKNCEKAIKEAEDYKAGWQRAQADYKNLQKEISEMRSEWVRMSEQQILEDFIPVYDNFKKAFVHHPELEGDEAGKKIKNWIDGVGFIMKQFENVLKSHSVEEIKTVGEIFNPEQCEAVGEEESDQPEHTILKEVDAGYMMKGKVIKVAKVIVAKNNNS